MPSGRSGSSSRTGSSRSGGFSRTSSSRGGFSSGGSHHHRGGRTTVVVVGGRRRGGYYSHGGHGTMNIIGTFAIISLFAAIIGLVMMFSASDDMKKIETEHIYYQAMLANDVATRQATVTDHIKNDKGDKWWFEYEIIFEGSDETVRSYLEGWSLPIYNYNQLPAIDSTITVVLSNATVNSNTNSIPARPIDIELTKPENDGDYIDAKNLNNIGTMLMWICGGLFVALIVAEVAVFARLRQNRDTNTANTGNAGGTVSSSGAPQETYSNCPYCSAKVSSGDKKCSNCGAHVK